MTTPDTAAATNIPPRRRTGGRSERVRTAVFAATVALLRTEGYAALSIGAVAAQAGVHETSIYRRWGTKASLVLDALSSLTATAMPAPDTGTLRGDLLVLMKDIATFVRTPEWAAGAHLALETGRDATLAPMREAFWEGRFARLGAVVARAVERGELPPETYTRLLIEALMGPIYVRVLFTGGSLDARDIAAIVDIVLYGVARSHPAATDPATS